MSTFKLFIITSMFISIFTCNSANTYEEKVNLSDAYACDEFKIENEQYTVKTRHSFKVRIITIGSDTFDRVSLEANLKDFGDQINSEFNIVKSEYDINCGEHPISYHKMLDENYLPGYITIIIVCTHIQLEEESIGTIHGAALGIPELTPYSTIGKPILFLREDVVYGKILHHELAHVFGEQHTFKDYDYHNKGMNCDTRYGDGHPDTVTPLVEGAIGTETCTYYAPEEALAKYTKEEIENMVKNPLSYSPASCMGKFEPSQVQKMRKMIEVNTRLQDCLIR